MLPVLFIGHGSPMNAIAENTYTKMLNRLGEELPRPRAILCVSAHWMTEGTWITHMARPKTIHDFYGFPQPLFDVQYPAPGAPEIADEIIRQVKDPPVNADDEMWGLDHGTWAVLRHMYPKADIPVMQLSLHLEQPPLYHYQVGQKLKKLREEGILIVGSGNLVHNLRRINWSEKSEPFPWAVEFDQWTKEKILAREDEALVNDYLKSEAGRLSVPTPEHYYPLLYVLGASDKNEKVRFPFEEIHHSSIAMRSFVIG
ncbi:MAG: 4,5-DOPA dioxygenase extradiol [Bacteriovoracaceae bacterium]